MLKRISKIIKRAIKWIHQIAKKAHKNKHFWKNAALVSAGVFILIMGAGVLLLASLRIPDFRFFEERKVTNSIKIYDRTGEILLYNIHGDIKRTDISSEEMGVNIKNATVAIEDSEFYNHSGVRITSIVRAVLYNTFGTGRIQGGSTITQQLVKNTLLTQKKTYTRKIKEWVLAIKIDRSIPKEKILEYYLNEAPYGGNVYGIAEASRTYFNKNAWDLTLAEAAYLAAIPQAPTTLSPYGKNTDRLEARKNLILARMLGLNFISKEAYDAAKSEQVVFVPRSTIGIKAPHFVFFIKDYIGERYGNEVLERGGLKIISTINYELQEKGELIVKEGALQNEQDWNGNNASLVAIDPKTGQILTMIGSRDYFDEDIDGSFNVSTASRQPGSSFKPFIYATAFNKGFTPDTVLFDLPTEFQTTCDAYGKALPGRNQSDCYMPANYDGKYRGPMNLRNALAQSVNLIAVKLFYLAGTGDALRMAENMGISTLTDIRRYGLTLVIGGGEVTLLDMTSAYGIFADDGKRNPYTGILKIEDSNGQILEEFKPNTREVLLKNTALIISDILSDEQARIPTFGANSSLFIPGKEVAVKTGTTNNNRDAWIIGYTPSIVAGVWAGNNDNKPMKRGGAAVAGPIWNKFMNEALKTLPDEKFERPNLEVDPQVTKPILRGFWQGNENIFIDRISGKLATEYTPQETREEKVITNVHTILYWIDKNDILGPAPSNPARDPQFTRWEIPVQNWWAQNRGRYETITSANIPVATDDVHTDSSRPNIVITEPNEHTVYSPNQRINLKVSSFSPYPLLKMDVFINNIYLGTHDFASDFSFIPAELENLQTENELKIIARDVVYNSSEATLIFKVK